MFLKICECFKDMLDPKNSVHMLQQNLLKVCGILCQWSSPSQLPAPFSAFQNPTRGNRSGGLQPAYPANADPPPSKILLTCLKGRNGQRV